jgi:HD superfamily phosphohydrolase
MEDLQNAINDDLQQVTSENKSASFSSFEKMSKIKLEKQEKKLLQEYCEQNNLYPKDLTERQKERLSRKELANLIKPAKTKEKAQSNAEEVQEIQSELTLYQDAFITALSGDYSRADALAHKNILVFVNENVNGADELSERAQKMIKFAKVGFSAVYLGAKYTGGFKAWKDRFKNLAIKIKNKVKNKKNV